MSTIVSNNGRKPSQSAPLIHEPSTRQPFIIAIANQKGGVAKTTTALSLGGALVQYKQKVLLVDLDPQANLTLALGVDSAKEKKSIANVILHYEDLVNIWKDTDVPGLKLIPANPDLQIAEGHIYQNIQNEVILRDAFSKVDLSGLFNYVIFDCPPSAGLITNSALIASNFLIIPTQPEFFSVNALRSMMLLIREVRASYNPNLTYRILITMLDKRNRIHRSLTDQIRMTFGNGLLNTIIETDTKIRESSLVGLPITFYNYRTRSALQYSALAQELIEYVKQKDATFS
jgi:chromosome partitioning protein